MSLLDPARADNLDSAVAQALTHPPPGSDPETIRLVARRLAGTAQVLRSALDRVHSLSGQPSFWVGAAATQFSRQVAHAPKHIDAVAERYDGYARELRTYAGRVEVIRSELAVRRAQLRTAWSEYQTALARSARPAAPVSLTVPADRLLPAPAPVAAPCRLGPAPAPDPGEVIYRHRRVADSFAEWQRDAGTAARGLHSVDGHNALQNPQGLHAFVNGVSTYAGDLSAIASVAGVIALVLCPVLAPALFAVATTAAAAKAGADVDRKAQYGDDVDGFDFADDALGIVPASGFVRAARAGTRAAGQTAMHSAPYVVGAVRFGTHIGGELNSGFSEARTSLQLLRTRTVTDAPVWRVPRRPTLTGVRAAVAEQGETVLSTALGLPGIQIGTEQAADTVVTGEAWLTGRDAGRRRASRPRSEPASVQVTLPSATGGTATLRIAATRSSTPR